MTKHEQILLKMQEAQGMSNQDIITGENKAKIAGNVDTFWTTYNNFYQCEFPNEDLTEVTTQAYRQSMNLSKERLRKNGLTMKVEYIHKDTYGNDKCTQHQNKQRKFW